MKRSGFRCETKKNTFRFVSVFRTLIETAETNKPVSKKPKKTKKIVNSASPDTYSIHWTLVGKHVQDVQHRTLVDCRQAQMQNTALVDRNAQMQHRLLKTDTSRCCTKLL